MSGRHSKGILCLQLDKSFFMTDTNQATSVQQIDEAWVRLWDYAQGNVNFDGLIDFDKFYKFGNEIFDVRLKNEE